MSFLSHLEERAVNILILEKYNEIEREKIRFGVRLVFSDSWKVMIVYLIAFCLDVVLVTLLTHLIFFTLRQVCFEFHFQNSLVCLISNVFSLPIAVFFIKSWYLESKYIFSIALISTIALLLFAPIGTEKRPIFNGKHRRYLRKKLFIRLLIIWTITLFLSTYFQSFILYAIILIAISVLTQKLQGAK